MSAAARTIQKRIATAETRLAEALPKAEFQATMTKLTEAISARIKSGETAVASELREQRDVIAGAFARIEELEKDGSDNARH